MILLTVRDLSRQFDVDPVFRDVTFDVRAGEKIGLVGPNGTGKTTLLKILAGQDEPDTGQIEPHAGSTIAILEQDARFAEGRTLIQEAKSGLAHLYGLQTEAIELAEQMANVKDDKELAKLQKRYDDLQHELEKHDAYHIDHRVDEVLTGLGFTEEEYDRPLSSFSGGQQNRVLLARLLLRAPDVMLLDEPTNHLDIAAIGWLEQTLKETRSGFVLISHDRAFLRELTRATLWIDRGMVRRQEKGFAHFEEWRDKVWEDEDTSRHKLDRKIRSEGRWAVEGISARRKRNQGRVRALQ
ncbi:MAG: ABC-F family ATP-binding cassette domain-containing protein, partial [Planctomycetaceae bacterium]|nr:ABC-F family ATP-binding cassette domain-containing protein [Planctomycetaceae bacterium]